MGILTSRGFRFSFGLLMALTAVSLMALPAFAAKQPKADVCHYQAEDELDSEGNVVSELGWRIIEISGNAVKAHEGIHTDGTDFDFVIDDAVLGDGNDTSDCEALTPFIVEVDEDEFEVV